MKLSNWKFSQEVALVILLILVMLTGVLLVPGFAELKTQMFLSRQVWEIAWLSIPMTCILLTGGIDLSVGSIMGLCATSFGLTYHQTRNLPSACLVSLLTGLFCGAVNGLFIARWRLHPLIVTLATFATFRGIAEGVSQGRSFSGFPDAFFWIGRGNILGVPPAGWGFLVLVGISLLVLHRFYVGKNLYCIGLNRLASAFSGVPVRLTEFFLYTGSGLAAGAATIIYISRFNTAKADAGMGIELDVITAVVVGGTSIFGGRGTLIGTILGVILIHETKLLVGRYWQVEEMKTILVGILLIGTVLCHRFFASRSVRPGKAVGPSMIRTQ